MPKPPRIQWSLERTISTAFWLAMVALFAARLHSFQSLLKLGDTSALVEHSYEVVTTLEQTMALANAAEASHYRFILSGEDEWLERYRSDEALLSRQFVYLQTWFAETPDQLKRLLRLRTAVGNRMKLAHEVTAVRLSKGLDAALAQLRVEGRTGVATNLRELVNELKREESWRLETRRREAASRFKQRMLTFSFFAAIDFLLLTAAYCLVSLYIKERARREKSLFEDGELRTAVIATQSDIAASQSDLEKVTRLIAQRTQDLTRAEGATIELIRAGEQVVHIASGKAADLAGRRFPARATPPGKGAHVEGIVLVEDLREESGEDGSLFLQVGFRSMIVLPLRHRGDRIGTLRVLFAKPSAFGERQIQTMVLMSGFLSAVVAQASQGTMSPEPTAASTPGPPAGAPSH